MNGYEMAQRLSFWLLLRFMKDGPLPRIKQYGAEVLGWARSGMGGAGRKRNGSFWERFAGYQTYDAS